MTDWRELQAMTDRIVLDAYAETMRHSPMKSGQTDPGRPQQLIKGVFHSPNAAGTVSFAKGMAISFATQDQSLAINREDFPNLNIQIGDAFRAMDRAGQPLFHVSAVSTRHSSIIVVSLGA